jgi:GT2 family glycosyltransferase
MTPSSEPSERSSLSVASQPEVSVVVTGWKDAPHLLKCLAALQTAKSDVSFEVILALNEPSAELLGSLKNVSGIQSIVSTAVNLGFGEVNNRGAEEAKGRYLYFLNDDAFVNDDFLGPLVECVSTNQDAGAAGSVLIGLDGSLQDAGGLVWRDGEVTVLNWTTTKYEELETRRMFYCSAAGLLVDRSLFWGVGGFDPGYFPAYYEDVDLCFKLRSAGWTTWSVKNSVVAHLGGSATDDAFQKYLHSLGLSRFKQRWRSQLQTFPAAPAHALLDQYIEGVKVAVNNVAHCALGAQFGSAALSDEQRITDNELVTEKYFKVQSDYPKFLEQSFLQLVEKNHEMQQNLDLCRLEIADFRDEVKRYQDRRIVRIVDRFSKWSK